MGDPNAHHLNHHHHLIQHQRVLPQHQLVGGPGAQHLITDPQAQVTLAAAPQPMHPQHQFQPQHYNVLDSFWQQQVHEIRHGVHDFKVHQLPLARIKKVMKTDEEVKVENHSRPQYATVSAEVTPGPSARPVTAEQVYQHHYYNQHVQQHSSESHQHNLQTQHLDHVQQRQPDHHPVQIKYESESPILRPVDWYSHSQQSYVQSNPHVGGHAYSQPISGQPPHEYHHESSGMNLTRHSEGYGRGGGQQ
ncbi:16227_t:CDS:2, partial [Racocetra fulgida]